MTSFAASLRRASWRNVPFGLEMGQASLGRRKVQHDYPYRDSIWLEDQGKLPRAFRLIGFLVGDSAVYGGGDVLGQLARMEAAAEAEGPGVLVHPTRGRLTLELSEPVVITERWDEGNYFELQFAFVQTEPQQFPTIARATGDQVARAAATASLAARAAFVSRLVGPLKQGLDAAAAISSTARAWTGRALTIARDATALYNTVSRLGGANYGRYFNGRNSGFLAGLSSAYAGAASIEALISAGSAARARVQSLAAGVDVALGHLGVSSTSTDVAAAISDTVDALQACAANPADGLRMLTGFAGFAPLTSTASTVAGLATSDLFRRSAVVSLARIGAAYAPSSADDAHAVRDAILAPLDREIASAGGGGSDDVFAALRDLRRTVVDDLGRRGGSLARLATISTPQPLPAIVLAQRQYGDAGRADELIVQADPVHPWFMPTAFSALGR